MSNYTESLDQFYTKAEDFMAPVLKANQMAVANVEKLVEFQLKTFSKYVDMGISQMKAASSIDSPKALQSYMSQQVETANALRQHMMDDLKALTDLSSDIREDMTKLAEDNVKEFKNAAAKTAKKAA